MVSITSNINGFSKDLNEDHSTDNFIIDVAEKAVSHFPHVYSMVVAAGKGSRFGAAIPKQYTQIHNKTILEWTVSALSQSRYINDLFLVIAKEDSYAKGLNFTLPIDLVEGGAERWHSVRAGVEAILSAGAKADDLILIHDAARPCVLKPHIDAVIEVAKQTEFGAILGVPVVDTLKKVDENLTINTTVDRSGLWQAQTPQVFRAGKLYDVLQQIAEQGLMITDEASAFEILGYPIQMVQSSTLNLKLTHAEDLSLIQTILSSRN